jgi:4-hydroxybenzoate polyprenyltransferase
MQRGLVIFLITALVFIGALHYPPLWFFVLIVPVWLAWWLQVEEERIHNRAIEQVRNKLKHRARKDD